MGTIKILSQNVVNKIAAGEVVERPASVVKELVENSLDAGATDITIEVKNGGKDLIRVIDNGSGMSYDDAVLSVERHATSKIQSIDDLESISTFGFRGEALPSIAAVSRFELITKLPESVEGTRIRIDGGVTRDIEKIGCPSGSRVTVSNLFYNVPARRKFLKSNVTELEHIVKYVINAALSHPAVSFKLVSNDRIMIEVRRSNDMLERMYALFGREFTDNIIHVETTSETANIKAFIGKPDFTKPNRDYQIFFLNLRPIRSNLISSAVNSAFKSILPKGRYPVAIIFIEIDPRLVDVNVHPAKLEVRFRDERELYAEILHCLNTAIQGGASAPKLNVSHDVTFVSQDNPIVQERTVDEHPSLQSPRAGGIQRAISDFMLSKARKLPSTYRSRSSSMRTYQFDMAQPKEGLTYAEQPLLDVAKVQVKGCIFNTYIIAETDDELLFIDQHIADERITYERLRQQVRRGSVTVQGLLAPVTVELSQSQIVTADMAMEILTKIGFDLGWFGKSTIIVRAVPSLMQCGDVKQAILDLFDEVASSYEQVDEVKLQDNLLIKTACHSSIQAGEHIADSEASNLVKELFNTEQPFFCPHGRPIIVRMKKSELDEKFQRK